MPQGNLVIVSKFNERLCCFSLLQKKKDVEWMDNVNRYGYVYIYHVLLLNRIEWWQLLFNRTCFFKGRFKLIKLGDDDRNSSSAITDKAYSSPDSDPDARGSGISGLNDSYFALIDPYLCNLKLNLWQLLNHQWLRIRFLCPFW